MNHYPQLVLVLDDGKIGWQVSETERKADAAWWRSFVRTWGEIGRAHKRRADVIKRYGLPDDAPYNIARPIEWTVLGAPDDWDPVQDIPPTRAHCVDTPRPCPHVMCPHNLLATLPTERPGRPHGHPRRIPGLVVYRENAASCALDVADDEPDGMTAEEVGEVMHVVGERTRQIEHRAALKMEGVKRVLAGIEAVQAELPAGIAIEGAFAHNENALPNQHFVTVAIRVTPRERRGAAGVTVRRRK